MGAADELRSTFIKRASGSGPGAGPWSEGYSDVGWVTVPAVIGRVTHDQDRPRGPDVRLELRVPERWLSDGATVEIALPRNLPCALCDGGGCDTCDRSGAMSLRGRDDPDERVQVTLPRVENTRSSGTRGVVLLRVPDYGGMPPPGHDLPRGNLLLCVRAAGDPSAGVMRIGRGASSIVAGLRSGSRGRAPDEGALPWKVALIGLVMIAIALALIDAFLE
jgi:hypothetical protein